MSQNCGTVVHSFKQDVEHVRHQQQLARVPGIDAVGQCSWNALFYFFSFEHCTVKVSAIQWLRLVSSSTVQNLRREQNAI